MQSAPAPSTLPFFSQLRWRLTALFLTIAILPIALITLIVAAQVGAQYEAQIFNQLASISTLKQQQVNTYLETGRETLDTVIVSGEVRSALSDLSAPPQVIPVLRETADRNSVVDAIFIYTPDGGIRFASDSLLLNRVVTRQPYFDASLLGDHLEAPYFDVSLQQLVLVITTPIMQDETVIAVAALRLNTGSLNAIMLERAGLGESGETYLVSRENGYLLTESRFEGFPQNRAYTSLGIARGLDAGAGFARYPDYRGVPVFGNYRWIPDLESALLSEIDEREVLGIINQTQIIIAVLALVISALVALIGLVVSTRIARPISRMTQTAAAIAQGKFDQRIGLKQNDEIGVLATAFDKMAQSVQERTAEMRAARDEALAAQRIARENSRLKSEFLATMSHELRTPMNAILGFTSIMKKRISGVEYNEVSERYLTRIHANSERLLSLINDFLDLSRVESGRMELANLPIVPTEMARKWAESLTVLAEAKGLEFRITVDPSLPRTIQGDEEALSKIAVNLIGNAIKFTETGSVMVHLTRQGKALSIAVSDTGIGIAPHAREFIFDEFRQVDQSSKRKYGGTGLGLAIAQKVAREMGGTIALTSELGVGSTFTLTVPLNSTAETALPLVTA